MLGWSWAAPLSEAQKWRSFVAQGQNNTNQNHGHSQRTANGTSSQAWLLGWIWGTDSKCLSRFVSFNLRLIPFWRSECSSSTAEAELAPAFETCILTHSTLTIGHNLLYSENLTSQKIPKCPNHLFPSIAFFRSLFHPSTRRLHGRPPNADVSWPRRCWLPSSWRRVGPEAREEARPSLRQQRPFSDPGCQWGGCVDFPLVKMIESVS